MVARVGDFGIAKLLGEEDSMAQTHTLATIGYMAPGRMNISLRRSTLCVIYLEFSHDVYKRLTGTKDQHKRSSKWTLEN
ncbi:hypothetical protein Q3G72_024280 [Acer saccharum]|nr:hypothetical protein Q3G72_024280 [Acer saccharum]